MKVAVDIRPLLTPYLSGVGFYTKFVLEYLLKQEQTSDFYFYWNSWKEIKTKLPPVFYQRGKVITTRLPNKLFSFSSAWLGINFWQIQADIFWLPAINFIAWPAGVKRVVTCHDLSWIIMPEFYSKRSRFWHWLTKAKQLYRQADLVLSVSFSTTEDLVDYLHIPEEKIKTIPLGVNPLALTADEILAVKEKYNLPDEFVLYIGNIEPRKNIEGILSALSLLRKEKNKDINLVVAGGSGWHRGYFVKIKKMMKADGVRYLGYITEKDKWALYHLAKFFVYPSFYEGFGLPPLEAMSQGCPVVTSHVSSLPEVVGGGGLLVDPYNIGQIAYAIDRLWHDEALRQELSMAGRLRSRDFSWQKTAELTAETLISII